VELPQLAEAGAPGPRLSLIEDASVGGPEAYRLRVDHAGVTLSGSAASGLFYAGRSLLLLAAGQESLAFQEIEDAPRFRWRAAHLDVARHFFDVAFVERYVELLALHKLNVFHWHLTDDQGWRLPVPGYPRLAEVAAYRGAPGLRHGGFYSREDVQRVVQFAAERGVTVVPEIEMPGHARAALAAYPKLSCRGGPFDVPEDWGVFEDVFCAGNDATFDFLEGVLDEVLELFPSEIIHVGGDECPKDRWRTCPRCQARMKAEGLADEDALQSWFMARIGRYLASRGRRLAGWDEILDGGAPAGATVMSWRGVDGGVRAAELGHDVVMTPTSYCYLDYKQSDDEAEPGAWFGPALTLESLYAYEPLPAGLSAEQAARIVGVQANVWTERMMTPSQVEYMVFPRLCAFAEVAWSSSARALADFETRLSAHLPVLDRLGVRYRGSPRAQPEPPSSEERERYVQARRSRSTPGRVAALHE
jgi:hexosaminidase